MGWGGGGGAREKMNKKDRRSLHSKTAFKANTVSKQQYGKAEL